MNRPSYKKFVEWIAGNDEPRNMDQDEIEQQVSVVMVSDLFGVPARTIAMAVIRIREKWEPFK